MMSSDHKYRMRLDALADSLQHAREEQRRMPPGPARDARERELDALEHGQDTVRRTLGLPLCRERAERARADAERAEASAGLAAAHQAEIERLGLTREQRARRLRWYLACGLGVLLLAVLLAASLD